MYFKWHMHWYDSNLWTYHKEITNYDWKMYMKEKIQLKKIAKMTVTENWDDRNCKKKNMISYGHLSDFLKSDFLFHIHFSVVICDFLVESSYITIVLMHVSFKIHYTLGVKLMTITAITVIPRWRTWNRVRIFFVD
jgi:hypothetical protein